jgi:alpha-tubulin suppressor-like RCC1 family protein
VLVLSRSLVGALAVAIAACNGSGPSDATDESDAAADTTAVVDVGFPGYDVPAFDAPPPVCLADAASPSPAPDAGIAIVQIAAGERHTCALLGDGTVRCWGHNGNGELGSGSTPSATRPTPVPMLDSVQQIAAGGRHTCALRTDGSVWCWGANESGELGGGVTGPTALTRARLPSGVTAASIAVGSYTSFAVTAGGAAYGWGRNDEYQLGTADTTSTALPVLVSVLSTMHANALGPGSFDTCAIVADGTTQCWGANAEGETGDCLGRSSRIPGPVVIGTPPSPRAPIMGLQRVVMSMVHTCALDAMGSVLCWGNGVHGQLGQPPPLAATCSEPMGFGNAYYAPLAVPMLPRAIDVAVSAFDSCAVLADGTVRCWGANTYAQLATCDPGDHAMAVSVGGLAGAEQVTLGIAHVCTRIHESAVYCWGDNEDGRLGDGTTTSRATPEPVVW